VAGYEDMGQAGEAVNEEMTLKVYGFECTCGNANGRWIGGRYHPNSQVWWLDKETPFLAMAHHIAGTEPFQGHQVTLTQKTIIYIDRTDS